MKKYFTLLALLTGLLVPARATDTVTLNAGQLTGPAGADTMQVDDSSPSNNGSLLLLVDLGSGNTLDTSITAGDYTAGNNFVLGSGSFGAGGFNNNLGTNETQTQIIIPSGVGTTGDEIALLWFPQITYSQYKSGTLTIAGDYFGAYVPSPLGQAPADGGSAWVLPSDGSTFTLDFFTSNAPETIDGGNESPSAGYANYQIEAAPEPSTFALFGFGALLMFWFVRRRKTA